MTAPPTRRPSVFVLERLSDDDIEKIVTQAVQRVSDTAAPKEQDPPLPSPPLKEIEVLDDDDRDDADVASSQPDVEEPLAQPSLSQPSSSTQASAASQLTTEPAAEARAAPAFPAYPHLTSRVLSTIVALSTGDARTALSLTELVLNAAPAPAPTTSTPLLTPTPSPSSLSSTDANGDREERLLAALRRSVATAYDRAGDAHYDMVSALHKCVRGGQGGAALYWLARMLTAGEDPLFVARRMVVCASEDVGMADARALPLVSARLPNSPPVPSTTHTRTRIQAMATYHACQVIGMPECRINLAHLVTYLAEAPKSTRAYEAYARAEALARADPSAPVPLAVRNAPTRLMDALGYGRGYRYNPDYA